MMNPKDYYFDSSLLFDSGLTDKPDFTFCLSTYNFENSVLQSLKTLIDQSTDNYEIIVHDDHSCDNTCSIVVDYLNEFGIGSAKRVRVYRANTNGGILTNRLRGFARSDGKWLILTDGDDFSPHNRLELIQNMISSLDHEPMLISCNRWNWQEGTPYEQVSNMATVDTVQTNEWIKLSDIVSQKKMPNGSSGFILNKKVFDFFYSSIPKERIIADDPVLARRALLIGDVWVSQEPVYYCRLSGHSASGAGCASKNWIIDRYNRWNLLLDDIKLASANGKVDVKIKKDIEHKKRTMLLDARLIDCPHWQWPYLWTKMIFLSWNEAKQALKKRIKLIIKGNVNASWK